MSDRRSPTSVQVRFAEGAERRACRMLLHTADRLGHLGDLAIATTADDAVPQMVGALSMLPLRDARGRGALFVSARVIRPWRRRGVGSRLLDFAISEAGRVGAATLMAQGDPQSEPEGVVFLDAKGFVGTETLTTFEAGTRSIAERLGPLLDHLRRSDRIPPDARMVPLRHAPLVAAARLHAEHLAGTVRGVSETINDLLVRDDADDHAVLMIGDEVHGLLLGNTVDGVTVVEAEVLAPSLRTSGGSSGWASAFMLGERLEWGLSRGSRITRFSCVSGNRPTRRLASRLRAKPIREEIVFRLALAT